MISLLRTGVDTGGITYTGHQLYFGRLLTFLTIGILQALVAVFGNIYILNCYVADKGWFVLFAVLISIVFVTIVFTLVSVFGNLGKGIAIVFMVLQFSSSGGTFPISTTGHFFQILNPFMPFTYAISLLREAVGGFCRRWSSAMCWLCCFSACWRCCWGLRCRNRLNASSAKPQNRLRSPS